MLLASVTTMAEGKREGWEYWGGSCLWGYTREGKGGGTEKQLAGHMTVAEHIRPHAGTQRLTHCVSA